MGDNDRVSPGEIETGIAGRACEACHKKKTKCDMQQPVCGLCRRTNKECHFPSTRKRPSRQDPSVRAKLQKVNGNLDRLVELLDAHPELESEPHGGTISSGGVSDDRLTPASSANAHAVNLKTEPSLQKQLTNLTYQATPVDPSFSTGTFPVSYELAVHLIDLFFDHVQTWLPLFHKPSFLAWSHNLLSVGENATSKLNMSEAVMFNALFALSARFSNHQSLAALQPRDRGEKFIRLTEHWFKVVRDAEEYDLTFLKACILMAWYHYGSGSTKRGWFITHICIRGCYEMGLHQIDDGDEDEQISDDDWIAKESLRRTFWSIMEIDSFGSIMKRKPFAFDYRHVHVKMPISDEAWFSGQRIESAKFIHGADCWKTLVGCPNQDERAWNLLSKATVGQVFDLMLFKQGVKKEQLSIVENSISCFKLAMPEAIQLQSPVWQAPDVVPARKNWVVATNLYLATAACVVTRIPIVGQLHALKDEPDSKDLAFYGSQVGEINEILNKWPLEAILVAHPCLACVVLTYNESLMTKIPHTGIVAAYRDLSGLILGKIAERWQLGAVLMRVRELAHNYYNSDEETKAELVRQYPVYFEREIQKNRKSIVEESQRSWSSSAASPSSPSVTTRRSIDHSHSPESMPQSHIQRQREQTQPQQVQAIQPSKQIQQSPKQYVTNFTGNKSMPGYFDPGANDTNVNNFQEFPPVSNLSQSPQDIDTLFAGFLQEPWWSEPAPFNFVI